MNHKNIDRIQILNSFIPLLESHGVCSNMDLITSKAREQECVFARFVICSTLRKIDFSFEEIGYIVNRNHTSVMYMVDGFVPPRRFKKIVFSESYIGKTIKDISMQYHLSQIEFHQSEIKKLQNGNHQHDTSKAGIALKSL